MQESTELSLQESEVRYRRLFEAAQDGILILDAGTGAITDVNPYLISMLGYSRDEFVEKKLWEVGAFKDIEASQIAFKHCRKRIYSPRGSAAQGQRRQAYPGGVCQQRLPGRR